MCDNYKACISLIVFILKTCCFNHIYGFENYLSNHKYILSYSNLYLLGPYFYLFLDIVLMYLYRCLSHIMIVNICLLSVTEIFTGLKSIHNTYRCYHPSALPAMSTVTFGGSSGILQSSDVEASDVCPCDVTAVRCWSGGLRTSQGFALADEH